MRLKHCCAQTPRLSRHSSMSAGTTIGLNVQHISPAPDLVSHVLLPMDNISEVFCWETQCKLEGFLYEWMEDTVSVSEMRFHSQKSVRATGTKASKIWVSSNVRCASVWFQEMRKASYFVVEQSSTSTLKGVLCRLAPVKTVACACRKFQTLFMTYPHTTVHCRLVGIQKSI